MTNSTMSNVSFRWTDFIFINISEKPSQRYKVHLKYIKYKNINMSRKYQIVFSFKNTKYKNVY